MSENNGKVYENINFFFEKKTKSEFFPIVQLVFICALMVFLANFRTEKLVGKCRLRSENVGKCRKMSGNVGKCREMSEIVGKCRKMSGNLVEGDL